MPLRLHFLLYLLVLLLYFLPHEEYLDQVLLTVAMFLIRKIFIPQSNDKIPFLPNFYYLMILSALILLDICYYIYTSLYCSHN